MPTDPTPPRKKVGGARPGAGRPKGSRDNPLILARTLTIQEAKTIQENAQVIRARVQLNAWEALQQQLARIDALPAKERIALIGLALKYADHVRPTSVGAAGAADQQERPGADVVMERLRTIRQGLPVAVPRALTSDDIVDAEIVDEPRWAAEA